MKVYWQIITDGHPEYNKDSASISSAMGAYHSIHSQGTSCGNRTSVRTVPVTKPFSPNTLSTIQRSFLLYARSRTLTTSCTSLTLFSEPSGLSKLHSSKPSSTSLIQVSDSRDCRTKSDAKCSLATSQL